MISATFRLAPLSIVLIFRISLSSLFIPGTSVAAQCHFPLNPIGRFARTSQSNATRRRRAEARRRSRSESVENRFLRNGGINAPSRIAMQSVTNGRASRGYADAVSRPASASAKSSLARAPHKSIPPRDAGALEGRLQQRSGVQTQFWSVPFIRDSLLQVNRNCRGRDVDAVEHSIGKGGVVSSILTGRHQSEDRRGQT